MIEHRTLNDSMIITIHGEIDHHSASGLRKDIDFIVKKDNPKKLVLDFSDVSFCDSSGIAVVLGRYKLMSSIGGFLELTRLPPAIRKIFDMADIGRIIKIAD